MVKIEANPSTGAIVTASTKNPQYGYVRVTQTKNVITPEGWVRMEKRSALLKGETEQLMEVFGGMNPGTEIEGNLVIQESLKPFGEDKTRDIKVAPETGGVTCKLNGQPIYRRTLFMLEDDVADELIAHNNREEIKKARASVEAKAATTNLK